MSARYGDDAFPVLDGVDLVVHRGGLTVVHGKSGAGKSTLLDVVLGYCPPPTAYSSSRADPSKI